MGNFLSIAAVTKILRFLIQKNIDEDLVQEGATERVNVISKPINEIPVRTEDGVNIFLYQISPNTAYRNSDLPFRDSSGVIVKDPIYTGVDLNYIITAYSRQSDNNVNVSDQKFLASIVMALHQYGVISKKLIRQIIFDQDGQPRQGFEDIEKMDIDRQPENIKITINSLTLDEISKLWSSFAKDVPYMTSISINVGVIILDKTIPSVEPLPVQERKLYTYQNRTPKIISVEPRQLEYSDEPIINILGKNLFARDVVIDFGYYLDVNEMPNPLYKSDDKLTVTVPPEPETNKISLGPKTVQVVQPLNIGKPESLHSGFKSNVFLFEIVPRLINYTRSNEQPNLLTVIFEPPITFEDDVNILIGTFKAIKAIPVPMAGGGMISPNEVKFELPQFPDKYMNRNYPIRIQINGVSSLIRIENDPNSVNFGHVIPYIRLDEST
ncbi:MAG: DUF4255 domain-containing protein [Candidatus Nitrosocosmicus sp.]|nr:DUF4255 domain-containing protein [Candidatus Nitrosocosmicus sp.]